MLFGPRVVLAVTLLALCSLASAQQSTTDKNKSIENAGSIQENHEDWTVLSVRGMGLKSSPPESGEKADSENFSREIVRLEWRVADPVDLYIVLPRNVQRPRPILYLYGYPSDTRFFLSEEWCKAATEGGFAAVGFLPALTSDRYRGRALKQWFLSELPESLGATTHDVQMILDYLEQRGDMKVDKVGMYAEGAGASIAMLAASVDTRITVLDVVNPWGDWPNWLKESPVIADDERAAYTRAGFLANVSKLDPVGVLPGLKSQSLRIQQVDTDRVTPKSSRDRIASAAPRLEQVVHYKDNATYLKEWKNGRPWAWLKSQLQPAPDKP